MGNYFICLCLFKVVLPLLFSICIVFRPCGISAIYLLFNLYLPIVPVPTQRSMMGSTGTYLRLLITVACLTLLAQCAFHIVLAAMPPYGHFLQNCQFLEKLLRHIGLVQFGGINAINAITWISPEILLLNTSVIVYVCCKRLVGAHRLEDETSPETGTFTSEKRKSRKQQQTKNQSSFFISIGKYLVLILLCFAATILPTVEGGLYFLVFLSSATWWACYRQLSRGFAIIMRCLMLVVILHILVLYGYQFQWAQEYLEPNSTYARYFGLVPYFYIDCTDDTRTFKWSNEDWSMYLYPFILYCLYYSLVIMSKALLKPQMASKRLRNPNETTPLIRAASPPSKRYLSGRRSITIAQDSLPNSSVTGEDIPMEQLSSMEEEYGPTIFDSCMVVLDSLLQILIRSSYIATNIIMMAWSITYLSWITFVLLLWANCLWLVPKQRQSMLRSSPVLVVYAWFLLISAYMYSMNLTEEELPSSVQGFNLSQIGFQKNLQHPTKALIVKCLYTVMFWITLKQYIQERIEAKQSSALADMVAPLQVTVGAATTGVKNEPETSNKTIEMLGVLLRKFATKFWIWGVAITLFGVAVTGQRMTVFRILYMALFLVFILSFQLSFRIWRRIMFGFWSTLIVYSMINLILVYTYQFDNFPEYWRDYLHVPLEQQLDIGLERFEIKQLFVRLVTPTFFIIITVIQLHYFHIDFMELSDQGNTTIIRMNLDDQSFISPTETSTSRPTNTSNTTTAASSFRADTITSATKSLTHLKRIWLLRLKFIKNVTYTFLELHMPKFVLFFAMLMCVYDICILYLVLLPLIVLATATGYAVRVFTIYASSIFVSILLLMRMIYQIQYIDPDRWNVTCEYKNSTKMENNAHWLGFHKTEDDDSSMGHLLRWNIAFLLMVTLWSVILVRQYYHKLERGLPTERTLLMFPRVTRADADRDIWHCVQYLFNYGYYKFGVEFSLMATVALIGFRMDVYALMYSVWLCVLFAMEREILAKIWPYFMWFIAILIPVQYFMAVGLPPTLCVTFPWDTDYWEATDESMVVAQFLINLPQNIYHRFQEWAYLLDTDSPPSPKKLMCDFVLLLMVARQQIVFRIEARFDGGREYPGGSNDYIVHLAEQPNFVNPVPDFITFVRSYLDIAKRGILLGGVWITLAIVFLTGTNRVNVFSVGYLIGAFVFLWQGTDLYLRPIPIILKSWNWFLGYNVAVILCKTTLQIVGCIFIQEIPEHLCWIIQVFGIGCIRKFGDSDFGPSSPDEPYDCRVPREFVGLVWDGLCFGFLIMQRRIYHSYYFFHMIDETKAATILASRGAELYDGLHQKRIHQQEEQEKRVLEKIRAKMDRIKANQQKIQGADVREPTNHYNGRPRRRRRVPITYRDAVLSGDYYMFDDMDVEDLELIDDISSISDSELDKENIQRGLTVGEMDSIEPKASTSKDAAEDLEKRQPKFSITEQMPLKERDIISELDETQLTCWQKIMNWILFIWAFINSCMISATQILNKYSRDYRYVIKVLIKEKRILKESTNYTLGLRNGPGRLWQPIYSHHTLMNQSKLAASGQATIGPEKLSKTSASEETSDTRAVASTLQSDEYTGQGNISEDYDVTEMSSYDQPAVVRLLLAIWHIFLCRSELLCYFVMFLNQIKSANLLTLPLPFMVFLWGTLTVPRPTKTFWVTIIGYTEAMVLIKCMFQFDIIPWNSNRSIINNPFYPPRIIGIERKKDYAIWDLLLLLVVFFHRFMLKSMGLWRTTEEPTAVTVIETMAAATEEAQQKEPSLTQIKTQDESKYSPKLGSKLDKANDIDSEQLPPSSSGMLASNDAPTTQTIAVHKEVMDGCDNFSSSIKLSTYKYSGTFKQFFGQLLDPIPRVAVDVYSFMFLCDFFNFFVILIGYNSFGTQLGDGGVSSYLEDNRVPVLFLIMLIAQFMLIIIDRGIFLRKNILFKVVFQVLQVFILHIWLFILFPVITERNFNSVIPPQMYYMVKCFYLLLSAYQIRSGYPTRILGNFLCKGYGYVNMVLFKGFMLIPFLFELRTIMDWMWTNTSMTVFDWIKMEDIFAHIFQIKCIRYVEAEYPQIRGERKSPIIKYLMGGGILALIIGVIWFPLVFFSLGNAVGEPNPPYDVSLEVRIGPYEPVYQMSAQSNSIYQFTEKDLNSMTNKYSYNRASVTFISNYQASDVAAVRLSLDSANIWSISPPDRNRMMAEINSTNPLNIRLQYRISHKTSKPEDSGVIPESIDVSVPPDTPDSPSVIRENLLSLLLGQSNNPVQLNYILPKFVKVTGRGTAKPISQLMNPEPVEAAKSLRNISLYLHRTSGAGTISSQMSREPGEEWWQIQENCSDYNYNKLLKDLPYADCESIILYTFNDKIFPATLNIITGGGIIGLYTTLVFVASRLLRGFFAEQCFKIMFEDLPNVDRVLQLCFDIYLVREVRDFKLEEDLFAKLVFLFRSPETLIKWTRPKEEHIDDDDPEDD